MTEHKCVKVMWGGVAAVSCGRSGKYEHEGKWYCKQHHPPTLKAKDEARREKWRQEVEDRRNADEARMKLERELELKAAAYDRLVEWLGEASPCGTFRAEYIRQVLTGQRR